MPSFSRRPMKLFSRYCRFGYEILAKAIRILGELIPLNTPMKSTRIFFRSGGWERSGQSASMIFRKTECEFSM